MSVQAIAAMVMLAADAAVMDGLANGTIRTEADRTRVAVNAAIECAVRHHLLLVAPDYAQRLAEGITIRIRDEAPAVAS